MEYRLSEYSPTERKVDDREGQCNVWYNGNCKGGFIPVCNWILGRVVEVYHGSDVNTHNCRIWESDDPHSTLQVPLHSPNVTVWCGFSASFILGPYFFEELGAGGPVTCSITVQRYASLLRNKIIPDLQARQCLSRIIFMQDGAPQCLSFIINEK
ncbi:uncharacterized protein TNCV_4981351 [Trichonephila clavipes]|nr:uncharacterized protein TNCV_4981351 [Trichonephila clavipes]